MVRGEFFLILSHSNSDLFPYYFPNFLLLLLPPSYFSIIIFCIFALSSPKFFIFFSYSPSEFFPPNLGFTSHHLTISKFLCVFLLNVSISPLLPPILYLSKSSVCPPPFYSPCFPLLPECSAPDSLELF